MLGYNKTRDKYTKYRFEIRFRLDLLLHEKHFLQIDSYKNHQGQKNKQTQKPGFIE